MLDFFTTTDFYGTWYSLIPPIVMIILVLLTRRVLISLGVGIVVGALFITNFNIVETVKSVWFSFQNLFYTSADGWDMWSIQLIIFLLLLGILIAFLTATGGANAFGNWAVQKVKTKKGAQYTAGILGVAIFIDDYFNSLTVGQVARPITDRQKVSRAKLAYIIDSTSAPVTVLSPVSSWGAYIIGVIGGIITQYEISNADAFTSFVGTIPLNYYAIAAIILVFLAIKMNLNFGPMRTHEIRAEETGELVDPKHTDVPGDLKSGVTENVNGRISHLVIPIVLLVVTTITSMIVTGIRASDDVTIINIFANTDVNLSLVLGGLISVVVAIFTYFNQSGEKTSFFKVTIEGIKAMLPAIYILVLAWMIVAIIGDIGTDEFLAEFVKERNISISFLPFFIFIVAGLMAFATGTSWGTFGMMLPIAGAITASIDPTYFVPSLAAVLAGAVLGDHISPISDTTVLSSTGAGSHHIDHVMTQIPYALIAALAAGIGYLLFGLTSSMLVGLIVTIGMLVILVYGITRIRN
ncbi:Na+/H+ antiporter NhaC family protein [Bacillaceae bacterium W0354]